MERYRYRVAEAGDTLVVDRVHALVPPTLSDAFAELALQADPGESLPEESLRELILREWDDAHQAVAPRVAKPKD